MEALFRLFSGMPRCGPGSDEATLRALRRLPVLAKDPIVLDLGCGPGRQTLVLARELRSRIRAVDIHGPFLQQLERSARAEGLERYVEAQVGDMGSLAVEPGSVDLIWSEGAIYIVGFREGLESWRRWLRPDGLVAVTEITWWREDPPPEAKAFWGAAYPSMATIEQNQQSATEAGYEVLDAYRLPDETWWPEFYTPLRARMAELKAGQPDEALAAAIAESEAEIALFERHAQSYGYAFYLLRKAGG